MASKQTRVLGFLLATIGWLGSALGMPAVAAPGVPDEAQQVGPGRGVVPAGGRGLLPGDGQRPRLVRRRGQGPQHVAGLDRRQRPVLGSADPRYLRRLRSPQDHLLASQAEEPPRQPLALSRPDQRALLRRGQGARSGAVRSVAGPAPRRLPRRPVRQCREVSRRRHRRPRQEPARRLLLRRAHRRARAAAVPQPRLRRGRGKEVGRGAVLQRSRLLQLQGSRPSLSGRHVLRLLPCRAQPDRPAGRPREPGMGEHQRHGGLAVLLDRPDLRLGGRSRQLHVPAGAHPAPRHARHFAGLDRLHQQPAHHERDLQSRPAPRPRQALGRGEAGRR